MEIFGCPESDLEIDKAKWNADEAEKTEFRWFSSGNRTGWHRYRWKSEHRFRRGRRFRRL